MTRDKNEVIKDIQVFLEHLLTLTGTIKVSAIAYKQKVPYKGNISGALLNLGLIEWTGKLGSYTIAKFDSSYQLATAVRQVCIDATVRTKNENKVNKSTESIITPKSVVVQPVAVNPFGFTDFTTIMIEKGSIVVGDYILEGTFTITKNIE